MNATYATTGPSSEGVPAHRWVWPITAMTFVLGMFIALAVKSEKIAPEHGGPSSNVSSIVAAYKSLKTTVESQQMRIEKLQNDLAKAAGDRSPNGQMVKQLEEARFLAGLTKVRGPGIIVTLKDSAKRPPANLPNALNNDLTSMYIIHDVDIQRVLNELRAGGAEALAVNDQRVVATTSVRCVGPAVQVNGVPLAPPFEIKAIGDAANLDSTLKLPGGIGEMFRSTDPAMLSVVERQKIELPAYAGGQARYAMPVESDSSTSESTTSKD